ncbi:MAG: hexose kinase [Ilumatobacter sp.]|uniref:1-phosphofructokinase family hexose kinase n=1 Tax=Ilumatobacter sp. TaxID=1967498 RepID=UPI0026162FC1|nr:hexose kinase [Ilumatobacter sp.]MDJ0768617.1 hexose kinase [Ilumatobacter sp.]
MTHPVVTVTVNPALDVALTVDRLVPDHKLPAREHRRDPGGGGINVSRTLARLGVESDAWVAAGGPVGDELVERVRADGVEPIVYQIDGITREAFAFGDLAGGEQYRIVVDGPVITDAGAMFDAVLAACSHAEIVVLSGGLARGLPDGFYAELIDALEAPVVIVDAFGPSLPLAVERAPTLVKPSRRELATLAGRDLRGRSELESAAREVLARGGVGALLVSLGGDGAMLVHRGGPATWLPCPDVEAVASTVGSGDAMVAGLVAGTLAGHDLSGAAVWGVAAGTASVLAPGTGLLDPADFHRLLDSVEVSA